MEIKSQELIATVIPRETFSTQKLPPGTKFIKWEVENDDNAEHISFDVMKNVTKGVGTHAHQLKNLHYPQVSKNVILSKKLA
ncbi:hypothetical protein FOL76_22310, partial [Bacillus thuringiensis]|nr:hypothetical protein [Bacillus thuringiensis]